MDKILYATGNAIKFSTASTVCGQFGITLVQQSVDIDEIQGEEATVIARDKAEKAYALLGKPVLISDDSWTIPGLKGFPGPYMKSMNHWFTPEDWLRLTKPLVDRRIILAQYVIYQDKAGQQLFKQDIEGLLLPEIRGATAHPHISIVSFDGGKHGAAESGKSSISHLRTSWHDFAEWYIANKNPTAVARA